MQVSNLINKYGGNIARPTKFRAILTPPGSIMGNTHPEAFDILCKTTNIPEVTQTTIDIMIKGHALKLPGRTNEQQELTITFYLSENHSLRKVFYDWIAGCDDRYYGKLAGGVSAIAGTTGIYGDISLIGLDFRESAEVMRYNFEYLYPTNIGSVEFNTAGNNETIELSVTFAYYRYWHESIEANSDSLEDNDQPLDQF